MERRGADGKSFSINFRALAVFGRAKFLS